MSIGDVVGSMAVIAATDIITLQPLSGDEWVVTNIYYADAVEFNYFDGTNSILFDSDDSAGARLNMTFHLTNSLYMRVKNATAGAVYIAYDGIKTKE